VRRTTRVTPPPVAAEVPEVDAVAGAGKTVVATVAMAAAAVAVRVSRRERLHDDDVE
jgi:bifunctional ADP-heptose synthase (sugar kinase/adenylyltransferase)